MKFSTLTIATLTAFMLTACSPAQSQTANTTATNTVASAPTTNHATTAFQPQPAPADITQTITQKLETAYQGLKVASVHTSPIAGIYEVALTDKAVIYSDAQMNYMIAGEIIEVQSKRSLTRDRVEDLNRMDFSSLPLDLAIKEVRGNGTLQVVVFSDPDCPFCKRLEAEFAKMTDITIYTFLMPIASLHPDAARKSVQLWCQKDRTLAWTAWMREGKTPEKVAECQNPVAETTSLGEQLGFNGTPTLVYPNGKTQAGFMPMPQLLEVIKENQAPAQ